MPSRNAFRLAISLIVCAGPALAAPATPEQAQRLATLFERYVGHAQDNAVTVVPDGESYVASVDIGRLFAFLEGSGFTLTTAGSLSARLTPQTDGRWRVIVDGLPEIGAAVDRQASSVAINGYKLDGLFDPALEAFASASSQSTGSTSRSIGPRGSSTVRLTDTGSGNSGATDGGAGTINFTSSGTTKAFVYDADVAATGSVPEAAPSSFKFTATGSSLTTNLVLGNARNAAAYDLWAFLVAHGSKAELVANQPELKAKLKALLPFASATTGDFGAATLAVNTSRGTFGAADLSEHVEIDGPAAKDGVLSTLRVSGLALPPGIIPAWAAPLTPTALEFTQSFGPLNLTPALLTLIDDLDLGADRPLTDDQIAAFRNSLNGAGVSVRIAPSTLSTALMTLRFESDLRVTPPMVPAGTATIAVTGLDKTIDAIRGNAQGDPIAAQAIGILSSVKVLAKADGPDSYSWRIEAVPGGDITVNGNPLGVAAGKPKPRKHPALAP